MFSVKIFMGKGVTGQEKARVGFKGSFLLLIICAFARGNKISDVRLPLSLHSVVG